MLRNLCAAESLLTAFVLIAADDPCGYIMSLRRTAPTCAMNGATALVDSKQNGIGSFLRHPVVFPMLAAPQNHLTFPYF